MISFFYSNLIKLLHTHNFLGRKLLIIRKIMLKFIDPKVKCKVGSRNISIRLSHMLPIYLASNVLYDRALGRISKYIESADKDVVLVDIGANIGDTASLLQSVIPNIRIICVEGNKEFLYFLKKNFQDDNHIYIEDVFLTDNDKNDHLQLVSQNGTATLKEQPISDDKVNMSTLDDLISRKEYNQFKIDIIKV